jgi:hypothetical protein
MLPVLQRFLRITLIGGLPPAGLFAWGIGWDNQLVVADYVFITLSSAVLIGLALTAVAHASATYVRRRAATAGFFIFLMPVVGLMMTRASMMSIVVMPWGAWQALPLPPEPVVAISAPDCSGFSSQLTVRSQSGRTYHISTKRRAVWQDPAEILKPRGADHFSECLQRFDRKYESPAPPGRVVASEWTRLQGVDCHGNVRHVLLDDGSIWRWSKNICVNSYVPFFVFGQVAALLSSLIAGLVVVIAKPPLGWPRSRPRWSQI